MADALGFPDFPNSVQSLRSFRQDFAKAKFLRALPDTSNTSQTADLLQRNIFTLIIRNTFRIGDRQAILIGLLHAASDLRPRRRRRATEQLHLVAMHALRANMSVNS